MKKLLIMLIVVAMAAFLFVGCLPGVTPPEEEVPEEEVPVVAKTDAPYITKIGTKGTVSLYSTDTQYTNSLTTDGYGVTNAIIKLYVDDTQIGVSTTGEGGDFSVTKTMAKVKDGVRVLYVTATAPGLAESDASTKYTVTFDTTAPKLASAVADSSDDTITVTFSEDVNMALIDTTDTTTFTWAKSALKYGNWQVNDGESPFSSLSDVTISKLTDKKVRFHFTKTGSQIDTNYGYFVECFDVIDMATNKIATDSAANVGVTAIATP
ncbi:MAG: hypothetical protein IBV53_06915 [Candidatus Atribacteria bacterium]